ncbi:cobaltochelatase subunit CobN [Methanobrevibacter sp.]|uniref:cobaltochelatase subunit CobN n=1 Tax=Methanobrevibacter sp. TaxID=66852 RepID=UPI00386C35CE
MFKNKRFYLAIFAILIIILSSQVVFALENDTDTSIEDNQFIGSDNDLIDDDIVVEDCTESGGHTSDGLNSDNLLESTSENTVSSQKNYTLFFISDNPGTNILDAASQELFNGSDFKNVNIIVRSGEQIKTMDELELVNLLYKSDAFIGEWISTDVDAVLTSAVEKYPDVAQKQVFLILEPPSGNLNSGSSSINLIKQNTINYNKIFSSFTTEDIITYFSNTQRGTSYEDIERYIRGDGAVFNKMLNDLVLYKDINDKNSMKNQILYLLNYLGADVNYEGPNFTGSYLYGIYRERWFSLDEYIATYFNSSNTRTVGILESTMYVSSQQLHPTYAIIKSLEDKGYNVIPVFAAGGTAEQLRVMVESFTSAGSDISGFLANSSNYEMYVDAIISMVAYGVGGENFTKTIDFFEELNVPVFRAVHSDYVSNEQWELGSTGLTTEKSDKWWHVAIAEAQGIIDATFIGGISSYISNLTGARIVTYIPHERNIDLLTDRVDSWVDLKYAENGEKVLSIIYYNYPPGKQNIGSSYLDTITSIYNMLYTLKAAGYTVEDLPNNVSELEDMILRCGINVANWAPGELEKLANQSGVTLLPVSEYTEWFNSLEDIIKLQVREGPVAYIGELARRSVELNYTVTIGDTIDDWLNQVTSLLPDDKAADAKIVLNKIVGALKNYTNTHDIKYFQLFQQYFAEFKQLNVSGLNGWGDSPGTVMVVNRNGVDYFVIPGLTFGNIFIAPEPQRGWEADISNLYHCTAVAPTHQYLAAYYYMQKYYSNAMVFVGRHATHEWLPGKEILLSATDYGSVVVGDVPQLYFYISDGLGEAIQAKRRGFAVLISHLTSPMSYTHLYGNLTISVNLINYYYNTENAELKAEFAQQIRNFIIDQDYSRNLGLSVDEVANLTDDVLVKKLDTFLKSLQDVLYPLGLHALGQYWTEKDLASTVSVMLSFDFETELGETNLFDELSHIYYSKDYDALSSFEREVILNKSYDICRALIYWDVDVVYSTLVADNNLYENTKVLACLQLAKKYIGLINESVTNELNSMLNGLNGKYIPISAGGEVILNPIVLPTGRNMYQDQSQELPTQDAWNYAKTLALLTLSGLNDTTEKVIMGIWCVETARDDGALVASVLYLLGMKPVWSDSPSAGYFIDDEDDPDHDHGEIGQKTKSMPEYILLEDLTRPEGWDKKRIDVTVITSGLFRDLYSSQSILLDNAFRVALARSYNTIVRNSTLMRSQYGKQIKEAINFVMEGIGYYGVSSESLDDNYVAKHWVEDCIYYLSQGYNATTAGEYAITRIFAPPNGDYGAGISKLVSMSWTWNDTSELADFYLGRMGNMYSKNYWGDTNPLVFLRALSNSDTIVTSRNTNQYGVLDNDDFFDYWGGLSMTVEKISGKTPNMNVLMYANKDKAYIASLEEVMYQEIASRYDNPEWIKGMMAEGYSGARYMSNKFVTNLYGWQVTRPSAVSDALWNRVYNTYYNDKYNIGVTDWLKSGNNAYSLISMSGTMLTAIQEGYWNANEGTIRNIANTWAQATVQNGVACCDCSCGNIAMMQWAVQYVNPDILAQLLPKLYQATQNPVFSDNTQSTVPPENPDNSQNPKEASSNNPVEGSTSSATIATNSSSTTTNQATAQNGENAQGEAFSNVGAGSESVQAGSSSVEGADVKKSVEINPITSQSASEVGLSIIAVIGILCLIGVIALGYFRNRDEEEEIKDLDKLYNEKI